MIASKNIYVSPVSKAPLNCTHELIKGNDIITGFLAGGNNEKYLITDGIPDFVTTDALNPEQKDALSYYDSSAAIYDDVANLTFKIQRVDETIERRKMVESLRLKGSERVLELACGTGRDSVFIAEKLSSEAHYFLQDISRDMLLKCREKLNPIFPSAEFSTGNACALAYPDKYFDAVFSFGGIGVFGDISKALKEMVRVCKKGARIVVGDESMPPWLYETEYGRILMNNNPLFKLPVPLDKLPIEARDVSVKWIIGGVYYIIQFTVGEGEPQADFDLEIPGRRGGTLKTRYYGKLEGLTASTVEMAKKAQEKTGKSMHKWLDEVVLSAARKDLEK